MTSPVVATPAAQRTIRVTGGFSDYLVVNVWERNGDRDLTTATIRMALVPYSENPPALESTSWQLPARREANPARPEAVRVSLLVTESTMPGFYRPWVLIGEDASRVPVRTERFVVQII